MTMYFICLTNSPKPKYTQIVIIEVEENQQMLTFETKTNEIVTCFAY